MSARKPLAVAVWSEGYDLNKDFIYSERALAYARDGKFCPYYDDEEYGWETQKQELYEQFIEDGRTHEDAEAWSSEPPEFESKLILIDLTGETVKVEDYT